MMNERNEGRNNRSFGRDRDWNDWRSDDNRMSGRDQQRTGGGFRDSAGWRRDQDEPSVWDRWERNMDDSRGSYQRDDRASHSFGYGDDFAEGRNFSGSYDRNNRSYEDQQTRNSGGGWYGSPTSNFGGPSYGGGSRSSDRLYGESSGGGGYRSPGRVDYGMRGGTDYANSYRDRAWSDQPNRNQEGEGLWESAKRFFGIGPKGWKRSDERIREEVCEALARHPAIDASEMEVDVKDGVVTLTGTVESRFIKRRTEDVIDDISGVDDVRNELQVRRSDFTNMSRPERGMEGSSLQTGKSSQVAPERSGKKGQSGSKSKMQ